ncbi:MAG: hypothetical protein OXJ52_06610 [Oligoflexia bacterium]|nr:hypothetical protein [Oligoflexia bacterium]
MKKQSKTEKPITYFKDTFTLRQYSAFALTFNWIFHKKKDDENTQQTQNRNSTQYKKLTQTQHFQNVYKSRKPYNFQSILENFRNYFSHYIHEYPNTELSKNGLSKELIFLVKEAIAILEKRKKKLNDDQKKEEKIKDEFEKIKDNPLDYFPLDTSKNIQPTLALISALFLTGSQMSFLIGKFFKGKGITGESPKFLAIKAVLETLSQSDRVLIDFSDKFLSPKKEMAFAIWGRLEQVGFYNQNEQIKEENFPEDLWFMRQLILYLEQTSAFTSFVTFARVNPKSDADQKQKAYFESSDQTEPLKIRHNTIEVKISINSQTIYTNFGIQTLKYLVLAYINKEEDINNFVLNYFKTNITRKGKEYKSYGVTADRLKQRIDYFIEKYNSKNNQDINLYEQIRFICEIVNFAWKQKTGQFMGKEEFKLIQEQVRHYRKDAFREILKQKSLLDVDNLGLGKNNKFNLDSLIIKNRIQEVFKDILKSHLDWLKETQNNISKMSQPELQKIADRLKLKNQEKNQYRNS